MEVKSEAGVGSRFTVVLRADLAPAGLDAETRAVRLDPELAAQHPLRILVAEDNATNLRVIRRMLERLGYADVRAVDDGRAAVSAAAEGELDLVLMDIQMPSMDGLAATRAIRAHEAGGRRTHIVAMTANALPSDRAASREAGMDGHLAKPIDPAALMDALRAASAARRNR